MNVTGLPPATQATEQIHARRRRIADRAADDPMDVLERRLAEQAAHRELVESMAARAASDLAERDSEISHLRAALLACESRLKVVAGLYEAANEAHLAGIVRREEELEARVRETARQEARVAAIEMERDESRSAQREQAERLLALRDALTDWQERFELAIAAHAGEVATLTARVSQVECEKAALVRQWGEGTEASVQEESSGPPAPDPLALARWINAMHPSLPHDWVPWDYGRVVRARPDERKAKVQEWLRVVARRLRTE